MTSTVVSYRGASEWRLPSWRERERGSDELVWHGGEYGFDVQRVGQFDSDQPTAITTTRQITITPSVKNE
jgi:hypothetical protein